MCLVVLCLYLVPGNYEHATTLLEAGDAVVTLLSRQRGVDCSVLACHGFCPWNEDDGEHFLK